jgi:hypothetical protein
MIRCPIHGLVLGAKNGEPCPICEGPTLAIPFWPKLYLSSAATSLIVGIGAIAVGLVVGSAVVPNFPPKEAQKVEAKTEKTKDQQEAENVARFTASLPPHWRAIYVNIGRQGYMDSAKDYVMNCLKKDKEQGHEPQLEGLTPEQYEGLVKAFPDGLYVQREVAEALFPYVKGGQ